MALHHMGIASQKDTVRINARCFINSGAKNKPHHTHWQKDEQVRSLLVISRTDPI